MVELTDAVAVVTGGASGIGRATGVALARAGADVILADVDAAGAAEAAAEIEQLGRRALAVRSDVGRRSDVEDLIRLTISWGGHCDLYVSNAGVGCRGAAHEFTVEEWEELLAIDLWASVWAIRLLVPHMLERERGHIVLVSSNWGLEGAPAMAPYSVAKFGLIGLGESLARELLETPIAVSIAIPGAVATNAWRSYRIAGADERSPTEIDELRKAERSVYQSWPPAEEMAETLVQGIRDDRLYILQENRFDPDWYETAMRRRAADPDAFVLSRA